MEEFELVRIYGDGVHDDAEGFSKCLAAKRVEEFYSGRTAPVLPGVGLYLVYPPSQAKPPPQPQQGANAKDGG